MAVHRKFKPVILFHDYSYSTNTSGVTHRVHIPYGDPYYTPLIQKKKQKVGLMLQSNGKAWYDIIQHSRNNSPKTPPLLLLNNNKERTDRKKRNSTQLLLQHDGSNQYKKVSYYTTTSRNTSYQEEEIEEEDDSESVMSSSDSSCTSSINSSMTSPVPSSTMITRKRRGNLPKSVTAVLKQWLIDHCRNPYPTEAEKTSLKDKTGLTLNQISNWFINARRRLLPQILDTMHPNHTEQNNLSQIQDDPIPSANKKRKRSKNYDLYEGQQQDDMTPMEQTTTVVRRRRRYNKKSLINNSNAMAAAT